jgi:hypothetical protein
MNCYHCYKNTDDTFLADKNYQGLGIIQRAHDDVDDTIVPLTVDYEYPMCERCKEELLSDVPPSWIVILEPIEEGWIVHG